MDEGKTRKRKALIEMLRTQGVLNEHLHYESMLRTQGVLNEQLHSESLINI
jgi:hypothetical protein